MKQPKYVGEAMKASAAVRAEKSAPSDGGHKYPKMTAGACSGPGRLQKAKAYGAKQK